MGEVDHGEIITIPAAVATSAAATVDPLLAAPTNAGIPASMCARAAFRTSSRSESSFSLTIATSPPSSPPARFTSSTARAAARSMSLLMPASRPEVDNSAPIRTAGSLPSSAQAADAKGGEKWVGTSSIRGCLA